MNVSTLKRPVPRFERAINESFLHPSNNFVGAKFVGGDYSFRVWNLNTGDEIIRLPEVNASFDKSGKFIITIIPARGNSASEVAFLPFATEDMIDLICRRLSRNLTKEEWNQYLRNQPFQKSCPNLE